MLLQDHQWINRVVVMSSPSKMAIGVTKQTQLASVSPALRTPYATCTVLYDDRAWLPRCPLSALHSSACHCVMQSQLKILQPHFYFILFIFFYSEPDRGKRLASHSPLKKNLMRSQQKILTFWYSRAGFARLPVTYNTYTPVQYTVLIHTHTFDACFFSTYCIQNNL